MSDEPNDNVNINDGDTNGATLPSGGTLVVDAALSDWVYHRGADDQAIRLVYARGK